MRGRNWGGDLILYGLWVLTNNTIDNMVDGDLYLLALNSEHAFQDDV